MDGGVVCLLMVAGIVALLVYMSNQKANTRYRAECGECRYQSPWMTESQAYGTRAQHYQARHPEVPPGGTMRIRLE